MQAWKMTFRNGDGDIETRQLGAPSIVAAAKKSADYVAEIKDAEVIALEHNDELIL